MNNKKTMNKKKVMPTTEIVGAILQTHAGDLDLANFKSYPRAVLQDQGVSFADVDIAVVENESSMVHLCLPYYEGLEGTDSNAVTDSDLDSVSGGEIVAALLYGGIFVGGLTAVIATTVGGVAISNANAGKHLNGSPK